VRRLPFGGRRTGIGRADVVLIRGESVITAADDAAADVYAGNGELATPSGSGRFVHRARFGQEPAPKRAAVTP
jgi:hypothetical protein